MNDDDSNRPSVFVEGDDETTPERRLMCAVLLAAIDEALGVRISGEALATRDRNRQSALRWFREMGPDYRLVSTAAGFDPGALSRAVLAYVQAQVGNTRCRQAMNHKSLTEYHRTRQAA